MTVYYDPSFLIAPRRFAPKRHCRAFDLLHVAIAAVSEVTEFATFDHEQREVADLVGLSVVRFS